MTSKHDETRRRALQIVAGVAAIPVCQAVSASIAAAAAPNVVGVWRLVGATATDSGDRMILIPPVVEANGAKVTRELAWERISTASL